VESCHSFIHMASIKAARLGVLPIIATKLLTASF
jgi:uncharacterized protein (DUF697 family)